MNETITGSVYSNSDNCTTDKYDKNFCWIWFLAIIISFYQNIFTTKMTMIMVTDSNDNSCNFKTGFRIVIIKTNVVILTKIFWLLTSCYDFKDGVSSNGW